MKSVHVMLSLVLAAVAGCAGPSAGQAPAELAQEAAPTRCLSEAVQAGDIVGVEPLWVKNRDIKYPAYNLGGVIVALRDGMTEAELQQVARCRQACDATTGLRASLDTSANPATVIVRADDPRAARAVLDQAERMMRTTP